MVRKPIHPLCGVLFLVLVPTLSAGTSKEYPFKYALVDMHVSLGVGVVRTPEFPVVKAFYSIMILVEKPPTIPFHQITCMMGVTSGPLDLEGCTTNDPLLRADWAVWDSEHVPIGIDEEVPPYPKPGTLARRIPNLVAQGTDSDLCACIFDAKHIYRQIGSFSGEAGKKYVAVVKFTRDGSLLNATNPHMIVIKHKDMW